MTQQFKANPVTCKHCGYPVRELLPAPRRGWRFIHAKFGEEAQDMGHRAEPQRQ